MRLRCDIWGSPTSDDRGFRHYRGELTRSKTPASVRQWAREPHPWLKIVAPSSRLPATIKLGAGEADAISLAKELGLTAILMDERPGRVIAQREGLVVLPTLAVLEKAAVNGLLDLQRAVAQLQQTTIRVPPELVANALARDAARRAQPPPTPPLNTK